MITVSKIYRDEARTQAFLLATALARGALVLDESSTEIAGYKIYRNPSDYYCYVCDLGDRFEANIDTITENIWIQYNKLDDKAEDEMLL